MLTHTGADLLCEKCTCWGFLCANGRPSQPPYSPRFFIHVIHEVLRVDALDGRLLDWRHEVGDVQSLASLHQRCEALASSSQTALSQNESAHSMLDRRVQHLERLIESCNQVQDSQSRRRPCDAGASMLLVLLFGSCCCFIVFCCRKPCFLPLSENLHFPGSGRQKKLCGLWSRLGQNTILSCGRCVCFTSR